MAASKINKEWQLDQALQRNKRALGRLITLFEDPRPDAAPTRVAINKELGNRPGGVVVGITGTPGAGKSTLIGQLATRLVATDKSVAVVAVDPSSAISGGAILGDRTRVRFPVGENRLFFRSQAADQELGGVGRSTYSVCRLLRHMFDIIFVETVGIGQSEIEIQQVADHSLLVLSPLAGDQIQFMKAGIMEIPDAIVLNKCDQKALAAQSYLALKSSLSLGRPDRPADLPLYQVSALHEEGLEVLVQHVATVAGQSFDLDAKEAYFIEKWVRDEYGRAGLRVLRAKWGSGAALLAAAGGFDQAQGTFASEYS